MHVIRFVDKKLIEHARSLNETLEIGNSLVGSGGGFGNDSMIVSRESSAGANDRGRQLGRQVSPQMGSGGKVLSSRPHHASPAVRNFYTNIVSRNAAVVNSEHIRGRSASARRASSLVSYALREIGSRASSIDIVGPSHDSTAAGLRASLGKSQSSISMI